MKSKTKNTLTHKQITMLVKAGFGEKTDVGSITELKGGMFNAAYAIERVHEKDKIILKVSTSPDAPVLSYEKDLMPTEVEVYRMVAAHTTIPVPRILHHDFSKSMIDSNYFFMTALNGMPMSNLMKKLSTENLNKIKEELGGYFAQLHKIKGPHFGYFSNDPSLRFSSWKDAFTHMNHMILNDGKTRSIKLPYEQIEKALTETTPLLDKIREPSLVDYDLWPGNIFLIQDGKEYCIEGIVDFERAFWGDPYADFPSIFMPSKEIWKDNAFWKGYCNIFKAKKEVTKEDIIRINLYTMYLFIIMTVETYR